MALLEAQELARREGFIINRRGSISYWLRLVEESHKQQPPFNSPLSTFGEVLAVTVIGNAELTVEACHENYMETKTR